jgi:hypothetical protein
MSPALGCHSNAVATGFASCGGAGERASGCPPKTLSPAAALRSALSRAACLAITLWLIFSQYGCASFAQLAEREPAGDPAVQAAEPAASGRRGSAPECGASGAGVVLSRAAALIGSAIRTAASAVGGALKGTAVGALGGAMIDGKTGGTTFPAGTVIGATVGAAVGAIEGAREGLRAPAAAPACDSTDTLRPAARSRHGNSGKEGRDERISP